MNRLLILSRDADRYAELIGPETTGQLEIHASTDLAGEDGWLAACNIILGDPGLVAGALGQARSLEWVQSTWAGVDRLCRPGMRRDYVLSGVKGVFGPLMSEYVLTWLFALERGLFELRDSQRQGRWRTMPYRRSAEVTLGIVGLGSIGRSIAARARGFGISVIGLSRSGEPCEEVGQVYPAGQLDAFLSRPDYVVLTLPSTPHTRHFVNRRTLGMMKPSAVLMNVGRGDTVNEADLAVALEDGVIGGAVLDVFETEPLPEDSPLWHLPNVHITPHNAAVSFPEDIANVFMDNLRRFAAGRPLRYVIDFELGY